MSGAELNARYATAQAHFAQGQHQQALQRIQELLWEHPRHADLLLSKVLCLEALGRAAEALSVVAEAGEYGIADARFAAARTRLEQRPATPPQTTESTSIDPVALLRRLEEKDAPEESPLAFLTGPRVYVVVFLLMFLLLTLVGPMLYWGVVGR